MAEPYQPPESSLSLPIDEEGAKLRRKFWLRAIWISIVGVVLPPCLGMVGTVFAMVGAFGELSETGSADPEALAGDVSVALLTTAWGLVVSAVAFFVLIAVLIRFFTLPKIAPENRSEAH